MHLTARIKRNLFLAFAVTLISAGLVYAGTTAQAEPESRTEAAVIESLPAPTPEVRRITAEIEALPAPQEPSDAAQPVVPKSAKARALANGEPLPAAGRHPDPSQPEQPQPEAQPSAAIPETPQTAPAGPEGVPDDLVLLDTFIATAYCLTGTTSTGTYTTAGRTLAVNPGIIPYGTHVWIYLDDGTFVGDYYAEDTGSNMMEHPYVVDIYMGEDSYDACINWGAQHVSIYVERE